MELKQIKELMSAMGRTGMKSLKVKKGDFELELEKEPEGAVHIIDPSSEYIDERLSGGETLVRRADVAFTKGGYATMTPPAKGGAAAEHVHTESEGRAKEEVDDQAKYVKSPMVGTFYLAPSPDEPPYVKIGDRIEEGSVICIVEAMKVMNEIKAGVSGVVKEIMVDNSHPVEFGTKLFKIV